MEFVDIFRYWIVVIWFGLLYRWVAPTSGFDLENDFGIPKVLHRISKREEQERWIREPQFNHNMVRAKENDCDVSKKEKRSIGSRTKRKATIAWPRRSKFTAELYYAIPAISPPQITVPIAFGIPVSFDIPNATSTFQFNGRSAQDRYSIYGTIEGIFENFGINGRSCVLRAICERAEHHLLTNGVLSELVNLILSVATTPDDGLMRDYIEAERQGREDGNCQFKYSECRFSIFKLLGSY